MQHHVVQSPCLEDTESVQKVSGPYGKAQCELGVAGSNPSEHVDIVRLCSPAVLSHVRITIDWVAPKQPLSQRHR